MVAEVSDDVGSVGGIRGYVPRHRGETLSFELAGVLPVEPCVPRGVCLRDQPGAVCLFSLHSQEGLVGLEGQVGRRRGGGEEREEGGGEGVGGE